MIRIPGCSLIQVDSRSASVNGRLDPSGTRNQPENQTSSPLTKCMSEGQSDALAVTMPRDGGTEMHFSDRLPEWANSVLVSIRLSRKSP